MILFGSGAAAQGYEFGKARGFGQKFGLGHTEKVADLAHVVTRGTHGPGEILVELLAVDSDPAADMRDGWKQAAGVGKVVGKGI